MNQNKKKIIVGLAIVGAIALAGLQTAGAGPRGGGPYGWGGGPQCNDCGKGYGYGNQGAQQLDEETVKAQEKFMNDTVQLRKDMAIKKAEKRALMISDNPDSKRVSQLTGELFDLREQLHSKAEESGLENGMGFGRGPGMGYGKGAGRGCNGPGPGGFHQNRL